MKKHRIGMVIVAILLVMSMLVACGGNGKKDDTKSTGSQASDSKTTEKSGESTKSGDKIVIRVAHDNNVQTPAHESFLKFKEEVEKNSDGRIEVQVFPGGQMGSVQDTFEQVRRGEVEMSASTTSNFIQTIPEFAVWDSFYMFDDLQHAKTVLEGTAGVDMMKPLEKHGLTGIGYMLMGFRNFSNNKHPILKVEDLNGIKMRGYNPIQIKAWESLGAVMSNLNWNELFTSLQQNLIDGQECATTSFYTEKFYEAQKYWSLTQHVFTNFLWYANSDFMKGLSDADREIVMNAAKVAIELDWKLIAENEANILDKIKADAGTEVNEVPIEVRREMGKTMNAAVKEDIIANCGQEIYDKVFAEIDKTRK